MSEYPKQLCAVPMQPPSCGLFVGESADGEVVGNYTRTDTLPRWRPHTEPVPQDEPRRLVLIAWPGGSADMLGAKYAEKDRATGAVLRWCWWDEVDALLGGGRDS